MKLSKKFLSVVFCVGLILIYTSKTFAAFYITGPTLICTSGQFTVQNYSNETLVWSANANLTLTSTQGQNPATFTANGNGYATITATITCCGTPTNYYFYVWVGPPINEGVSSETSMWGYVDGEDSFAVWPGPSHISQPVATWYYDSWGANKYYDSQCYASFHWNYAGVYSIAANLTNSCGTSDIEEVLYGGPHYGQYTYGFEVLEE